VCIHDFSKFVILSGKVVASNSRPLRNALVDVECRCGHVSLSLFWWTPIHWAYPFFHNHMNCALNICFVLTKHNDSFGLVR
jgi:hypothetical protein